MASLNTLRTRYGIVLSVVIGLVLVAFILGDQLSMKGGQEAPNRVEKIVNGKNISSKEYYEAQQIVGSQPEIVDGYLAFKYYYAPQLEALGLEAEDMVTMQKTYAQYLANQGITREMVEQEFANLTPLGLIYKYLETVLGETLGEGFYLNTADLEFLEGVNKLSFSGRYVEYPYAEVNDIAVEDAEVKAYYDAHPMRNESYLKRTIAYVEISDEVAAESIRSAADFESFTKAVEDAGLVLVDDIMADNIIVDNVMAGNMGYEIYRWAQMTSVGAVREFVIDDKSIIVMVKSIDEDEYLPYEEREADIRVKLMNDKKFAAIAETMTLGGENEQSFADATFSNLNFDPSVARAILVANVGEEYKVNGQDAAYIFVVDEAKGELGDVASQRNSHTDRKKESYDVLTEWALASGLVVEDPAEK